MSTAAPTTAANAPAPQQVPQAGARPGRAQDAHKTQGTRRHFVLVNQFYPPDIAPTGCKLHDVARELAARGHEVHVICSRESYGGREQHPSYMELDGVRIHRLNGGGGKRGSMMAKIDSYRRFYMKLVLELATLRPRPDLIVTLTTPPFLGLAGRLGALLHHARTATWIMDLYPDVMVAHGLIRENGLAHAALRMLARMEYRRNACTLTLGPDMAARVLRYSPHPRWAPLWGDDSVRPMEMHEQPVRTLRQARNWPMGVPVMLYSGNMGLGHMFDEFLTAAGNERQARIWAFAGGGPRRPQVEQFATDHPLAPIHLLDSVPEAQLNAHLCSANAHLVSLRPEWQGMLAPSKLQNIFAAGRPVIFVGDRENILARWIAESGAGWIVPPGDQRLLRSAVADASSPISQARRGARARAFYEANFSARACVPAVADLWETAATRP